MSERDRRPLILLTNDDGIDSPGLRAAAEAAWPLGDLLVVAPRFQQTGAGRSLPPGKWEFVPHTFVLGNGTEIEAYAIESSPAQAVRAALMLLTGREPDLLVSGINYGENVGVGVTISGTVGAAIEAATLGVPGLAVSLETDVEYHLSYSEEVDFSVASHFTRRFARMMLDLSLPPHTDLLKLDVPARATLETPWRITRVSRHTHFVSTIEEVDGVRRFAGYERQVNLDNVEPDSDIYAVLVDEVLSLTPMTVDLTAQSDFRALAAEVKLALGKDGTPSSPPPETE